MMPPRYFLTRLALSLQDVAPDYSDDEPGVPEQFENDEGDTPPVTEPEAEDDFDDSSDTEDDDESFSQKVGNAIDNIMSWFRSRESVDAEDQNALRREIRSFKKAINAIEKELAPKRDEVKKLENILEQDFGNLLQFESLYDQCFEFNDAKYVYELCPFKSAAQKEGGRSTSLGNFKEWRKGYSQMFFDNGARCWSGPIRNVVATLVCGQETRVLEVSEPSICDYTMTLETPQACSEDELEELRKQLASF